MQLDLVRKFGVPVPRYTSYPTAPHFSPDVGAEKYAAWLALIRAQSRLSLYVHVPFCHSLCWYCGCNTKAVRRYEPVAAYAQVLHAEIEAVAERLTARHQVTHVHWGGGSPNILATADILSLADALRRRFQWADDVEFAVEIDPRQLEPGQVAALAEAGVNRVSIGVQDFDEAVQAAIGRAQSYACTREAIERFRVAGIRSVNIDLVYGLPHQTRSTADDTIEKVLTLKPDRIAIFGYAHLPRRLPRQRLINAAALPVLEERFAQAHRVASRLTSCGYRRVGLDHFALAHDPLACRPVSRNFQGYTTDEADALIGIGASAISRLASGYAQNAVPVADYARRIREAGLATVRGVRLTAEDRVRGFVIERLMCDLAFDRDVLTARFGAMAQPVIEEAEALVEADRDGLVEDTGHGFLVTERGRPFLRAIASRFDSYLGKGNAEHAAGV
jgi:oxygen-independent coproporphyrinogen-3 oxidase